MSKQRMVRVAESEVSIVVYEPFGYGGVRKTFKQLHVESQKALDEQRQLLTDLLLLEPSLDRFRHKRLSFRLGIRTDGWNRAAIKEAADLLRADAEDKAKRDRVAAFIKKDSKK